MSDEHNDSIESKGMVMPDEDISLIVHNNLEPDQEVQGITQALLKGIVHDEAIPDAPNSKWDRIAIRSYASPEDLAKSRTSTELTEIFYRVCLTTVVAGSKLRSSASPRDSRGPPRMDIPQELRVRCKSNDMIMFLRSCSILLNSFDRDTCIAAMGINQEQGQPRELKMIVTSVRPSVLVTSCSPMNIPIIPSGTGLRACWVTEYGQR